MKVSRMRNGIAAAFIFLIAYQISSILTIFGVREVFTPVGFSVLVNFVQIGICIVGVVLSYRLAFVKALEELGMNAPAPRAIVFSLIATSPMLIGFLITSEISPTLSLNHILAFTIISPFAEELLFRGYIFRQLYRRANTGFWIAALLPSMLFGLGHMYQSTAVWDFVGITLITGLGSIFFCWIFLRWQDNLWVPFGIHLLMNFWWMLFAVDETALGGWLANCARFLTVVLAIVLTVNKDRIWKSLPIEQRNVADFEETNEEEPRLNNRTATA